jgi:hypothetical protein
VNEWEPARYKECGRLNKGGVKQINRMEKALAVTTDLSCNMAKSHSVCWRN